MLEDYFWLVLGLLLLTVGIISFFKPKLLITSNTPKYSYLTGIEIKKYIKIRGFLMIIIGVGLIIKSMLIIWS